MTPLGPLRLLPQVRATKEESTRERQSDRVVKQIYGVIKALRLQMSSSLTKRKHRARMW